MMALALQLLAITHVTVLDMTGAPPRPDVTVTVAGGRIVAVSPARSATIPPGARRIDGRGKYLMPGLWDMHVHTDIVGGTAFLGLYVAKGVTGVRDMGGDWTRIRAWRDSIAAGRLVGPRIEASGPYLNNGAVPVANLQVQTPEQARLAVDSLASLGVDFVKIHSRLPRAAVFAALAEAKARHLPVGGHVSAGVTVEEVSDSGQKSLEHLLGFATPCTPSESLSFATVHPLMQTVFGRCTSRDMAPLFARLARNGTWVTPTLTAAWEFAILPRTAMPADSLAHYIPDSLRGFWRDALALPTNLPAGSDSLGRALFAKRLKLVGALYANGVHLLAGTDAPLRNSTPGFGIHEELAYFVQAGIPPEQVLRIATYGAAQYLGALDSLGTVQAGKVADLVLLEADPIADIHNTRRIALVVARGRVFDHAAIERLLAAARTSARSVRMP